MMHAHYNLLGKQLFILGIWRGTQVSGRNAVIVQVKVDSTYTQATWVTVGFTSYTDILQQGDSNKVCGTATDNPARVHRRIAF